MKKFLMVISAMCMIAVLAGCNLITTTKVTTTTTVGQTTQSSTTTTVAQCTTTAAPTTSVAPTTVVPGTTTVAPTTTQKVVSSYTINVYDIDGELLATQNITDSSSVFDALKNNFEVDYYESDWGVSLNSVAGSVVDSNWYLAIYENGVYASTGVEGLEIDENDVFDFKVECWNTIASGYGMFDEYDVLVDKAIYHYAKTYMQDKIKADTAYTSCSYWTYMSINMMTSANYDARLFNTKNATNELKESITTADVTALSGANYGKYFYAARALGLDLTAFTEAYKTYIESLPVEDPSYNEYVQPFVMSPAKSLNVTSDGFKALIATEYEASTQWGIDGLVWQVASLQLFEKYTADVLAKFALADQGNCTSTALMLLAYAALNTSPRTENADLIKIIFDNYYDANLQLVKYAAADTGVNYSTDQIYASLMAYKACRDSGKAALIFA